MIHFLPFFSVRKSNSAVDESRITSENRQPLSPKPAIKKKLPLLLKNRHFLDTTFMCIEAIDKMKLLKDMLVFDHLFKKIRFQSSYL